MNLNDTERSIVNKLSKSQFKLAEPNRANGLVRLVNENDINRITEIFLDRKNIAVQIPNQPTITVYYLVEYLMVRLSYHKVWSLISNLGFTNLNDDVDVAYNLLWLFHMNTFESHLTSNEIAYISRLSVDYLKDLFPVRYFNNDYNTDRASLLYAAVSGRTVPNVSIPAVRYNEVKNYPPEVVWYLSEYHYKILNIKSVKYLTPYQVVALHRKDDIENIFLATNLNNVHEMIIKYGVVINSTSRRDNSWYLRMFLKQISDFKYVFERPYDILPPPPLSNSINNDEFKLILRQYTTKELVDAYEPLSPWIDRESLIDSIIQESIIPKWTWRHLNCKNNESTNVLELIRRRDINKDDLNNPTLSYGFPNNYRCYQIRELIDVFSTTSEFRDPDYHSNIIDPITNSRSSPFFTTYTMKQLTMLLENKPENYYIGDLLNIIDTILERQDIDKLQDDYLNFNRDQKYIIELIIAWIFFYGMYMRFWKGPGYNWSYDTYDVDVCLPTTRDINVTIQNFVIDRLLLLNDLQVKLWISQLPMVDYNFSENTFAFHNESLLQTLQGYLIGINCMGIGGDLFIQTGYYLITHLLNQNINEFLIDMVHKLLDIERQVINDQLNELKIYINDLNRGRDIDDNVRNQIEALFDRQYHLERVDMSSTTLLYQFDPLQVQLNKHITA